MLNKIKTYDEDIELSVSDSIETLRLFHRDSPYQLRFKHTVRASIGLIIVNLASKDLEYAPIHTTVEDEVAYTHLLFRLLNCTEVRVFEDPTKSEIIEQFTLLQKESDAFEEYHKQGEVLSIIIRWIGWSA